jgi:hypothetical protein
MRSKGSFNDLHLWHCELQCGTAPHTVESHQLSVLVELNNQPALCQTVRLPAHAWTVWLLMKQVLLHWVDKLQCNKTHWGFRAASDLQIWSMNLWLCLSYPPWACSLVECKEDQGSMDVHGGCLSQQDNVMQFLMPTKQCWKDLYTTP